MTTMIEKPVVTKPEPNGAIPPLENGDRLNRIEFERRYSAMPHVKKAELIEGVVYMPSPVNHLKHGRPHGAVIGWLSVYLEETDGVDMGTESTIRLDMENEPQPDACLIILPENGGCTEFSAEGYIEGAPELVVEVASSSENIDMHAKLRAYRRNGVKEYVVWLVRQKEIRWFVLRDGEYEPLEPDATGAYRSEVFPGLALDPEAIIAYNRRRVAQVQREALNRPEHAEFVARLAAAAAANAR
jgi:Uma2 family endonuclease